MYKIELFRKQDLLTSNWAGGTTTQIAIYPPHAVYQDRNFTWRLSSANVDLAESDFTALPGFKRLLMALEGEVSLFHTDHHTTHLGQFMQDAFEGAWQTKSQGKCRDFNLIFRPSCKGEIDSIAVSKDAPVSLADVCRYYLSQQRRTTVAYYCADGEMTFSIGRATYHLAQGDALLIHIYASEEPIPVVITSSQENISHCVQAVMQYDA